MIIPCCPRGHVCLYLLFSSLLLPFSLSIYRCYSCGSHLDKSCDTLVLLLYVGDGPIHEKGKRFWEKSRRVGCSSRMRQYILSLLLESFSPEQVLSSMAPLSVPAFSSSVIHALFSSNHVQGPLFRTLSVPSL